MAYFEIFCKEWEIFGGRSQETLRRSSKISLINTSKSIQTLPFRSHTPFPQKIHELKTPSQKHP